MLVLEALDLAVCAALNVHTIAQFEELCEHRSKRRTLVLRSRPDKAGRIRCGYAALALGTLYSVTHGLGTTPTRISGVAICSSADLDYARGDVVLFPSGQGGSDTVPSTTFGGRATATVATMRSPSASVIVGNLTSGAQGGMTGANWYFLVLAEI